MAAGTTAAGAFVLEEHGGPEVMRWRSADLPPPGPGEAQVRHGAVGLNYIDVYYRTGLYPGSLPHGIGVEGAGTVEAVGAGVTLVKPGDRVAYAGGPLGAYSERRNMPAVHLVRLPEAVSFEQGAAMMLQGMTAQYLIKRTYAVKPGDTVLVHAAAGGVGLVLCQWLAALGVTTIATAGSDEKCELARSHGAAHCINYRDASGRNDFVARVKELTAGEGVPVVYDSVGKDTFEGSLECLRPFGTMVSFGNSSGAVPPFDLRALKGTLYITRPSLMPYVARREDLEATASDLMQMVASGKVKIEVHQRYALKEAPQAHRDLEARKTTGSTVLLP
jgi:NADPH2:quinone reductase